MNSYAHYEAAVAAYQQVDPQQRPGQAHVNVLSLLHPELADSVRGSDIDPFYDDERLTDFRAFVDMRLAEAS